VEWILARGPKYSEKTCPSATLSTTNPTWPDLGSNPGRRGGKPATNRLSYGAAPYYSFRNKAQFTFSCAARKLMQHGARVTGRWWAAKHAQGDDPDPHLITWTFSQHRRSRFWDSKRVSPEHEVEARALSWYATRKLDYYMNERRTVISRVSNVDRRPHLDLHEDVFRYSVLTLYTDVKVQICKEAGCHATHLEAEVSVHLTETPPF
jgi:hypothetical protein